MSQNEFSEVMGRHYASWLENGKSSVTLDKFDAIASALNVDPLVMMALCESVRRGISVREIMTGALGTPTLFNQDGLVERFEKEVGQMQVDSESTEQSRRVQTEVKIKALLETGLDQKSIAADLGLSPATVSRYCKRIRGEKVS